jgi:hypothetical protein
MHRPLSIAVIAVVVAGVLSTADTRVGAQEDSGYVIGPMANAQRLFGELINPDKDATLDDVRKKVDALRKLGDDAFLVRQAVFYEATMRPRPEGFDKGWAYVVLARELVPIGSYPAAVADLLYAPEEAVRKEARYVFQCALGQKPQYDVLDLSRFRDYIVGVYQKQEIAYPLKRALFETVPMEAFFLFTCESPLEIKKDLVIDYRRKWRVIDDALFEKRWLGGIPGGRVDQATADAMRELAASKYWWSRLFVAEIMVQNKEFRDPELVKQLEQDENELVRNSIASLTKPDPLRITPVDQ